ncbi:MAG: glycosyltransferase family 2 protein [Verrucomicrobiae bacterium]|nr:glycosyltransferase family 2 protein [Verrucomicrobiae bacterium]
MSSEWREIRKLSVLMPAYNEGRHIVDNLKRVREVLKEVSEFELIVIDDGSKDNTSEEIIRAQETIPELKLVRLDKNVGKGHALKIGFQSAKGDFIFFLDSDLDLPPEQMTVLWRTMLRENADVVIGSKRHPESKTDYPINRRLYSSGYFLLVKLMFGLPIHDTQTGLKLFRREVLEKCFPKLLVKSFAFDLELLMLAHYYGFTIAEAPVVIEFKQKLGGIGMSAVWSIGWDTFALFYRLRLMRYYDRLERGEVKREPEPRVQISATRRAPGRRPSEAGRAAPQRREVPPGN